VEINLALLKYQAIKLICGRVIHESEIVCRFLNKEQLKTQVRSGHINRKYILIQIHELLDYKLIWSLFTSSLKNAILTPLICELNNLRFILNGRTTINNDFRKNSSPKGSLTMYKKKREKPCRFI
jgi:hypothetical protein